MLTTNLGTSTTIFVGNHYEITDGVVTKYYFAGAQRIAMRTNGTLTYLISDHLGSTSIATDSLGNVLSQMKYKAWGEVRYNSGTTPTDYTYTGQYSHTADFGLMFYNARWYDPSLGRFAQADSIIPGGVQGLDRYGYVNNNPLRYTDPTGHMCSDPDNHSKSAGCDGADHVGDKSHGGGLGTSSDVSGGDSVVKETKEKVEEIYVGGATPAGVPQFSTEGPATEGAGSPDQKFDALGEILAFRKMFSKSAPSTLNVYLYLRIMENGDINELKLLIQNRGGSSADLNFIAISQEPLHSMNSCTTTEICMFRPDNINVEPDSTYLGTICSDCLADNITVYNMPTSITRNEETSVFVSMSMWVEDARSTYYSPIPFEYTIPRR